LLANRLIVDPETSVLLFEASGNDDDAHHHLKASACSSANLAIDIGFFPVTVSTSLDILDK
jgi:hypothetical protein